MKNLSQEEMKKIISDVVSDYKKNNDIDISIRLVTKKEFYQEFLRIYLSNFSSSFKLILIKFIRCFIRYFIFNYLFFE